MLLFLLLIFYKRIDAKYKREYLKLFRKLFIEIKKDKSFKFYYFREEDAIFIKKILSSIFIIGEYYKDLKRLFYHKYSKNEYVIFKIFSFIKITIKNNNYKLDEILRKMEYLELTHRELMEKMNKINYE